MLVFGDHARDRDPRALIAELHAALGTLELRGFDVRVHGRLVTAFIDATELAQGLADAEAAARGRDARGPRGELAMAIVLALGGAVAASWHARPVRLDTPLRLLRLLDRMALPDAIRTKAAEGYAYYAVYPEAYDAAARRAWRRRPGPRQVIGLRSIGTGLAAMIGAALATPLPSTVRPTGDAYRRTLVVDEALVASWCDPRDIVAIADEGPGRSGSSFGAVLDLLAARGVPLERIECYPSHAAGPGPAASARDRERWQRVTRHVVDVDELLVRSRRLADWLADIVGPLTAPLQDLSAGAWRGLHYPSPAAWPPVIAHQERRKFHVRTDCGIFLARFIGLGRHGEHAYDRARILAAAGFYPEVLGHAHGFMIERWIDGRPLDPRRVHRGQLVEHVARYLAFRARRFPADRTRGASATTLAAMAARNASLVLGDWARDALARFSPARLEARMHRIEIDGRLHAWEWIVRADGTLVKTDAIDHHAAHDLVGCQDLTWDLAGAAFELGLDRDEENRLTTITSRLANRAIDPELLAFARVCYLAFQLGRHALAGVDATAYQHALQAVLQSTAAAAIRAELR